MYVVLYIKYLFYVCLNIRILDLKGGLVVSSIRRRCSRFIMQINLSCCIKQYFLFSFSELTIFLYTCFIEPFYLKTSIMYLLQFPRKLWQTF